MPQVLMEGGERHPQDKVSFEMRLVPHLEGGAQYPLSKYRYDFRNSDEANRAGSLAHDAIVGYMRELWAQRWKVLAETLAVGLGEGWTVGVEEVGGGMEVLAVRPVTGKGRIWIDDEYGEAPQVGFYADDEDDGGTLLEIGPKGMRFGDDAKADAGIAEGILSMLRVTIETLAHAWDEDKEVAHAQTCDDEPTHDAAHCRGEDHAKPVERVTITGTGLAIEGEPRFYDRTMPGA